ncbi:hypothetical protein evm_003253 [Chilo suppressalis]|nr:hypothetical protein evm_003253 [Chilo suppressalis]
MAQSASEGTLSRWSWLHLQSLAPAYPHWARVDQNTKCMNNAMPFFSFKLKLVQPFTSQDYGHKSICLGCGVSVLRARSIPLTQNRQEYTVIREWADLPIFTKVCRPCWRRATRAQVTIEDEGTAE